MVRDKVIKFNIVQSEPSISFELDLAQFMFYREHLQNENLIGRIKTGKFAGYDCGNISLRLGNGNGSNHNVRFVISGSQTSSKREFTLNDISLIERYEPATFCVAYSGAAIPSSETPLHWNAYATDGRIGAIIHAHILEDNPLYGQMPDHFFRNQLPQTYGTSKSAKIGDELSELIRRRGYSKIIGMLNHDGGFGLLSFGENLKIAYLKLLTFHSQLKKL